MEKIAALSIDQQLKTKLNTRTGSAAILHSSFHKTVNYLFEGDLLTIATEALDNAVSTIRISTNDFKTLFERPAKEIYFKENTIQINENWILDWFEAKEWKAKEIYFPDTTNVNTKNLEVVKEYLSQTNQPIWAHGQQFIHKEAKNKFEQRMNEILYLESEKVFQALSEEPIHSKALNENHLFGLGRGLTPSGDDLISGILFVAATHNFPIDLAAQSEQWCRIAQKKTNKISATAIAHSSKGRGRERMFHFLDALLYSKESEVVLEKLKEVLAIGSSSGSEIAWGIIRTVEIGYQKNQNRKEEKHVY